MKTIRLLIICLLCLLCGCADTESQERIAELESQLESAQTAFDDVQSAFNEVQSAMESLKNEVDGFNYLNWRDVVPGVEDATINLDSAIDGLEGAIGDAEAELENSGDLGLQKGGLKTTGLKVRGLK